MKFFKYLIFILFSTLSINSFAYYFAGPHSGAKTYGGQTADQACANYANTKGVKFGWTDTGSCIDNQGSNYGGYEQAENQCRYDNNFTWDSSNPPPKTPPSSVCYNQCNFSVTWASSPYDGGKKLSWYGVGKSSGSSCDANTDFGDGQGQTEGGNGSNGSNGGNGNCTTANGTTTCTGGNGGTGGSGSGGSGGAGGAGGNASITVDMQSVVNAITELKNTIATKFQDLSVAITNMSAKITDAIGLTNEKLEDIKNNQKNQTTELKNAINDNADKITGAIKQNTNSVEAGSQNIKIAIDDNTTAVKNSSAQNQTSLEAVKAAIENINASVSVIVQNQKENNEQSNASIEKTVSDNSDKIVGAINNNGDKVTNAVNKGIEATKENGKKLDGINDSVKEGNGHLKDIKDYLKDGKDSQFPEDGNTKVDVKTIDVNTFSETIFGSSAQCPANKTLSMNLLGRRAFSYTFDFLEWCYYLGLMGNLILICAYIYASNIVLRS